ncbi:MAG: hypothetical protein ACLTXP_06600 [Odoribacter splanchnicus]
MTQRAKRFSRIRKFYLRYTVDQEKTIPYYKSPVEDWAAVYWGYIFEVFLQNLLVVDNYGVGIFSEGDGDFIRVYTRKLYKKYGLV